VKATFIVVGVGVLLVQLKYYEETVGIVMPLYS
jgi:hypothetical protein